jgi:hypothetical protein
VSCFNGLSLYLFVLLFCSLFFLLLLRRNNTKFFIIP